MFSAFSSRLSILYLLFVTVKVNRQYVVFLSCTGADSVQYSIAAVGNMARAEGAVAPCLEIGGWVFPASLPFWLNFIVSNVLIAL